MSDGGMPTEVPLEIVPFELRMPNTLLSVTVVDGEITTVRAWLGEP